jgi:hypothetical protein
MISILCSVATTAWDAYRRARLVIPAEYDVKLVIDVDREADQKRRWNVRGIVLRSARESRVSNADAHVPRGEHRVSVRAHLT